MARSHLLFARRTAALLAFCATPLFTSACEGCGEVPPDDPLTPARIIATGLNGSELASDGVSTAKFELRALKQGGGADTLPITVTVTSGGGTLESGTVTNGGAESEVTPNDKGVATIDVKCATNSESRVDVLAQNEAEAKTTFSYTCVRPQGQVRIELDTSNCVTASPLVADGTSTCQVVANVALQTGADVVPQAGVNVVVTATAELDDGTAGDPDVLSETATDTASSTTTVTTDAAGNATFTVRSPALGIVQTIHLRAEAAVDDAVVSRTADVAIGAYENLSDLVITATPSSVSGGTVANLAFTATDFRGNPAAGGAVTLTVPVASGATLTAAGTGTGTTELVVVLNATGQGTAVLQTPAVAESTTIDVAATFTAAGTTVALERAVTITVSKPGVPTLDVQVDSETIRSDHPTDRDPVQAQITLTVTRDGQPLAGVALDVDVAASETASLELAGAGVAVDAGSASNAHADLVTDATGKATVLARATNERVRGTFHVSVVGSAPDVNNVPVALEDEVTITVIRDAILQSLVFVSATPTTIGVRGGAYPSSTEVTFKVIDDQNLPMANVPVTFDVNETAPADVSVNSSDISDAAGIVSTVLSAGTQAIPVSVIATASVPPVTLTVQSLPISITAGLPEFLRSYMLCSPEAAVPPFTATCSVQLVDRFTNRAATGNEVQFRSEGGNITPQSSTDGEGTTSGTFNTGGANLGLTNILDWSYAALLPFSGDLVDGLDVATANDFIAADCFDGRSDTTCNIIAMCRNGGNDFYCPLPPTTAGTCADTIDVRAILTDAPVTMTGRSYRDPADPNHAATVALVDGYLATMNSCGFPASCLVGDPDGLPFIQGDECPNARGCYDFDYSTFCPQDGLLTMMASSRGEESFIDGDGDGVLDANETYIDMPEPYLDKNDNCAFDDFSDVDRLSASQAFRRTDQFIDFDESGTFGYEVQGTTSETNGKWDADTAIFFSFHILATDGTANLMVGEPCASIGAQDVPCTAPLTGASDCVELADGVGYLPACVPTTTTSVADGESVTLAYRWVDGFGNCPASADFGNTSAVAIAGPTINDATDLPLTALECGLTNVSFDAFRPWCAVEPALGAPSQSVTFTALCEDLEGPQPGSVTFSAGGSTKKLPFTIACAVPVAP